MELSSMTPAHGADVQYTLTINIQNHKAADILNNGLYKIHVGYPEDTHGFKKTAIEGKAPKFHCSRPVKVTFSARAVAEVDYFIGYAAESSPHSHTLHRKIVKLGQVYRLDDSGVPKIEEASWVHSNALGFENSQSVAPIVSRKTAHNNSAAAPTRYKPIPVWVPGRGLIVPPKPSMSIKVWLKNDSPADDDDDIETQDESQPFRVNFRKGNPTATIVFREDGTFGLNALRVTNARKSDEEEEL